MSAALVFNSKAINMAAYEGLNRRHYYLQETKKSPFLHHLSKLISSRQFKFFPVLIFWRLQIFKLFRS